MHITDLFRHWVHGLFASGALLREKYEAFRKLLEHDNRCHELTAELQQIHHGDIMADFTAVEAKYVELSSHVAKVVDHLLRLDPPRYAPLARYFKEIDSRIKLGLAPAQGPISPPFVLGFNEVTPDMQTLVGNKALRLATAVNELKLPVPEGFVVTSNGFNYFIAENHLRSEIDGRLSTVDIGSTASLERVSGELTAMVEQAAVPEPLAAKISKGVLALQERDPDALRLSIRSSGVGEDGRCSYAGQYASVLNVPASGVLDAYKRVIASKFSAHSLFYRIYHGEIDREAPMAVLVMKMVDAKASGVVYTRDPTDADAGADADNLLIYSLWGLGGLLVGGAAAPAVIKVSRSQPHHPQRQTEAMQESKAVTAPEGGTRITACDEPLPASFALSDELVADLAEGALRLEGRDGLPQDVEWCVDHGDRLFILQARPLGVGGAAEEDAESLSGNGFVPSFRRKPDHHEIRQAIHNPVLLAGGIRASGGIATGIVHNVEKEGSLDGIAEGSVLVARNALPDYVTVLGKAAALVTDTGSVAGHLATIARELGIPALVNTGSATEVLATGRIVTVDADSRTVYEGRAHVPELSRKPAAGASGLPESPVAKRLAEALELISPLNLVDPKADDFAPEGCRTFHDILRFSHEKSVMEMFSLGKGGSRRAKGAKRLESDIPIVVYVLDLGGGLDSAAAEKREIDGGDIRSLPFGALWKGLGHPGIYWRPDVVHFDWKEFDRVSGGIVKPDSIQFGSYAVVSGDYLNFHIHFGYHFVVVDTLCTPEPEHNYLALQFAGGGAKASSRLMRVRFLEEVLSRLGLKTETTGDLIDAQLKRCGREEMMKTLERIGILLGCTRVLDMDLKDGSRVDELVERFFRGDYALSPLSRR
jgi:pyruvate,water dikinase